MNILKLLINCISGSECWAIKTKVLAKNVEVGQKKGVTTEIMAGKGQWKRKTHMKWNKGREYNISEKM